MANISALKNKKYQKKTLRAEMIRNKEIFFEGLMSSLFCWWNLSKLKGNKSTDLIFLKAGKSREKNLPKNTRKNYPQSFKNSFQVFRSFFGRIEKTNFFFRDLLIFSFFKLRSVRKFWAANFDDLISDIIIFSTKIFYQPRNGK